ICHANLQIVLETFSHTQQASKYSLSNGAETALTVSRLAHNNERPVRFPGPAANRKAAGQIQTDAID
ncbi:hypothetical protein, partial [Sinorhizobium meliloti]|uniref:hypothetical protein n=1 Tax=Rhizobium meliloti TaxID=382 RepID=UPI000FE08259